MESYEIVIDYIDDDKFKENTTNRKNPEFINGNPTSSKFKGVHWDKQRKKWRTQIRIERTLKSLGYFVSETKAAEAYNVAAAKNFGEYAYLNIFATTNRLREVLE